jgi:hypothetical protein
LHDIKENLSLAPNKKASEVKEEEEGAKQAKKLFTWRKHFYMWCAFALYTTLTLWCSLVKDGAPSRGCVRALPEKEMKNGKMWNSRKIIRKFHINGF